MQILLPKVLKLQIVVVASSTVLLSDRFPWNGVVLSHHNPIPGESTDEEEEECA